MGVIMRIKAHCCLHQHWVSVKVDIGVEPGAWEGEKRNLAAATCSSAAARAAALSESDAAARSYAPSSSRSRSRAAPSNVARLAFSSCHAHSHMGSASLTQWSFALLA